MELNRLCELNGVSGDEGAVRKAIFAECKKLCEDVKIDRAGNVIAHKKGNRKSGKKHILFAAHMDEVGFIAISATEEGYIRIRPVGGIDPRVCVSKYVTVGGTDVKGVIGAMAIHLQTSEDRQRVLKWDDLYVDIGAKDQNEAQECCPPGSYIYFDEPFQKFGDGFAVSKALDDRLGCYNMLRILRETWPHDVTCAFVVKEEIGCRGSYAAAFQSACDAVIVLEGTAAGDLGDVPESQRVCSVGKGVAVSFMDRGSIADRTLFQAVTEIAKQDQLHYQIKEGVTGGNDARSFQAAAGGKATCVLSVPCRYIHGPSSVIKLSDVEDQLALSQAILKEL